MILLETQFDVLIIGSGVIGCAVARELSRFRLQIGVLEQAPDLLSGTSARNSGVLHAGFNNRSGSLMARFCVEGNRGFDRTAEELDIPYRRTGKLVVGFDADDYEQLLALKQMGDRNGVPGLELVDRAFIQRIAPYVCGKFAMWSPSTAILDPFQYTLGLAENAAKNGVQFLFDQKVAGLENERDICRVKTGREEFNARWVVNCAGHGADRIAGMTGLDEFTIYPCRGEYFVLDRKLGSMLPLPAYPVPNIREGGLGIHLTPTMDGNILVGPGTEYLDDRGDYSCTRRMMDLLISDGSRIFPHLDRSTYIRNFSGIRPKLVPKEQGGYHDFVIRSMPEKRVIHLLGIESPGLTGAMPIAHEVIRLIGQSEVLTPNSSFHPIRRRIAAFRDQTVEKQAALIRENPDYGEIICRCETITKAEVLNALRGPLGARSMIGVKYRCRTMMGRCQGGYCEMRIAELMMQERGWKREDVLYAQAGSQMFAGEVRSGCRQ